MLNRRPTIAEIEAAYRLFLGREADPGGLATYKRHAEQGMTLARLRQDFIQSEEFRRITGFRLPRTVRVGDIVVEIDGNEPEFGREISKSGGWEPHIVKTIVAHLKPGDVYVDIGANVGVMAFNAAAKVGPTGLVLAFEPHPDNIRQFTKGVVANDFGNIRLYPFALSDERATFSVVGTSNGYLTPVAGNAPQALALRGDDILLDMPRIDFVKMDIEGHEPFAIAGLSKTIARHRPKILCEFNPRCLVEHIGREPTAFAAEIFALTGQVESVEHDGSLVPITGAAALMDFWRRKNRDMVAAGRLPDGMVHLDLLFRPA